jgi:hypothetical protein
MDEIRDKMEIFKAEIKLPDFQPPRGINEFIQSISDYNQLQAKGPIELFESAVLLEHYSTFLVLQENRLKAYINMCENNLRNIVGQNLANSFGFTFQEKDLYIRTHEDNAKELERKKNETQVKLDYIQFMGQKLHQLSDIVKSLGYQKSRINRNDSNRSY